MRLGECRSENLYSPNALPILAQQSPLDPTLAGDVAFFNGDKIVVVEFKAPSTINGGTATYANIQRDKIQRVLQRLTQLLRPLKPFHFIGLLHSFAVPHDVDAASGLFGLTRIPYTTTFLKSEEVVNRTAHHPVFDLQVSYVAGSPPADPRIDAFIPSCAGALPNGFGNPAGCLSCGFLGLAGIRWPLVHLPGYSRGVSLEGFSYANLLHGIHSCQVGAAVESPREFGLSWGDLVPLFSLPGTTTLAAAWNALRGPRPLYVGGQASEEPLPQRPQDSR